MNNVMVNKLSWLHNTYMNSLQHIIPTKLKEVTTKHTVTKT